MNPGGGRGWKGKGALCFHMRGPERRPAQISTCSYSGCTNETHLRADKCTSRSSWSLEEAMGEPRHVTPMSRCCCSDARFEGAPSGRVVLSVPVWIQFAHEAKCPKTKDTNKVRTKSLFPFVHAMSLETNGGQTSLSWP